MKTCTWLDGEVRVAEFTEVDSSPHLSLHHEVENIKRRRMLMRCAQGSRERQFVLFGSGRRLPSRLGRRQMPANDCSARALIFATSRRMTGHRWTGHLLGRPPRAAKGREPTVASFESGCSIAISSAPPADIRECPQSANSDLLGELSEWRLTERHRSVDQKIVTVSNGSRLCENTSAAYTRATCFGEVCE
jgi:hypothetical protein